MKTKPDVSLADVQAVYAGPEGDLWELVMGEQIHIGGLAASMDLAEAEAVLAHLLAEVERRIARGDGVLHRGAVRVFWVNPVADLRAMNPLEDCGGRLAGTDFLFAHALEAIPEDIEPAEALARTALGDPMVGPASDRAERIVRDIGRSGAEAVVVSRIPGASHCASEGAAIARTVRRRLGLPVVEIEVPPLIEPVLPALRTRLEALVEAARERRRRG